MNYEKIEKILRMLKFTYDFPNNSHRFKRDNIVVIISNEVRFPNLGKPYTQRFKFYEKTKSGCNLKSYDTELELYNYLLDRYKTEIRKIKIITLLNQ